MADSFLANLSKLFLQTMKAGTTGPREYPVA